MLRFRKLAPIVTVALVAAVMLGTPPPSQAALTVQVSFNGGGSFQTFTANENDQFLSGSANTGGPGGPAILGSATVGVQAFTNQPTGDLSAEVSQVQLDFSTGGAAATIDLVVRVSDVDFHSPIGASTLTSFFSLTSQSGFAGTGSTGVTTFQSAADFAGPPGGAGILFGGLVGTPSNPGGADFSEVPRAFVVTGAASSTATYQVVSTQPFSLSNEFRVIGLTIGANSSFQLTGTTRLVNVPAPTGLVLALTGLPIFGFGRWLRRRKPPVALS